MFDICVGGLRNCTRQEGLPSHAEEPNLAKYLLWRVLFAILLHILFVTHFYLYKQPGFLYKLTPGPNLGEKLNNLLGNGEPTFYIFFPFQKRFVMQSNPMWSVYTTGNRSQKNGIYMPTSSFIQ